MCKCGGVWATLMLLVGSLAACAVTDGAAPSPAAVTVQKPGRSSVTVTADLSGADVVLERGQELIVRLDLDRDLNSESQWSLSDFKPGVLSVLSVRFQRGNGEQVAPAAMIWRFMAQSPGAVQLEFELRRPRRLALAERVATYRVSVP